MLWSEVTCNDGCMSAGAFRHAPPAGCVNTSCWEAVSWNCLTLRRAGQKACGIILCHYLLSEMTVHSLLSLLFLIDFAVADVTDELPGVKSSESLAHKELVGAKKKQAWNNGMTQTK